MKVTLHLINIGLTYNLNFLMKHIKTFSLILFIFFAVTSCKEEVPESQSKNKDLQRYELYKTENMWTFIKLDTQTGYLWQVQYSVEGDDYRFASPINLVSLIDTNDMLVSKRFKLQPTENMYNFILLDNITGRIWQVQWSTKGYDGIWEIL